MPVKCLQAIEKMAICNTYAFSIQPASKAITDLSYEYKVSRRTIIRVLEEGGFDPKVRRRAKADDAPVQQPIVLHSLTMAPAGMGMTMHTLGTRTGRLAAPIPVKKPWYRRLSEWLFGTKEQQDLLNAQHPEYQ